MSYYKLLYKNCPIEYKDTGDEFGTFSPGKFRVEISEKIKNEKLTLTLMHEGLHVWIDDQGFSNSDDWHNVIEEMLSDNYNKFLLSQFNITPKSHLLKKLAPPKTDQ